MFRDRRGSITVYTALFLTAGVSAGTLAVDVGRMSVLRSEMQNTADAAAMAGAVQLDGRDNARARALDVATNAAQGWSAIPSGGGDLDVASVIYYSALEPAPVVATSDADAVFIEVELEPKQVEQDQPPIHPMDYSGQCGARLTSFRAWVHDFLGPQPRSMSMSV